MQDFVQLWVYLSATPLFGLTATVVTYVLAHQLSVRLGQPPWANPVLWTVVALAVLLLSTVVGLVVTALTLRALLPAAAAPAAAPGASAEG